MSIGLCQSPLLASLPWCSHGFTLRSGGESERPFESLNLGLHVTDDSGRVVANRIATAGVLDFSIHHMVCAEQVHGGHVVRVEAAHRGLGALTYDEAIRGTDGLITNEPGVLLTLSFADCIPVFFADRRHHAIGIAHAGWRGIVANVVENTLESMRQSFGTEPGDVVAAIGPGIGPCCFEVSTDVADQFGEAERTRRDDGAVHLNLKRAVANRLLNAGMSDAAVDISRACTACEPDSFFSHRRDKGCTGRMAGLIGIRERPSIRWEDKLD